MEMEFQRLEDEAVELAAEKDDNVGIQVALLAFGLVGQLRDHMRARAAEQGLSSAEADALLPLASAHCGPIPMGQLAEQLRIDPSNLTNLVARLEARGLVSRTPVPEDRRKKIVAVTPAGDELIDRFKERLCEENPAIRGLDDDEVQQFLRLLQRVVGVPVSA